MGTGGTGGRIMFLRVNLDFESIQTEELTNYVKTMLPDALNEALFQDKNYLNRVIKEAVKGQLRSCITEILQEKDYRDFLRDKIAKEIVVIAIVVIIRFFVNCARWINERDYQII